MSEQSIDRNTALKQAAELRALITAYLGNLKQAVTKAAMQQALGDKLLAIVGVDRQEHLQAQYDYIVSSMVQGGLIKRYDPQEGPALFCANEVQLDTGRKPRATESEQALENRSRGQQARALRKRREKGIPLNAEESRFLRDYEAGRNPKPLESMFSSHKAKPKKEEPKQGELALRSNNQVAVHQPQPVHPQLHNTPGNWGHHPQAAHFNSAQPQGVDIQIFTPGGSVVRTSANSAEQLDALFASIKKNNL